MRLLMLLLILGTVGCASLPDVSTPQQVFTQRALLDETPAERPRDLPALHRPITLQRVVDWRDCQHMTCYAAPSANEPAYLSFGMEGANAFRDFVTVAQGNYDIGTGNAAALDERTREANQYIRMGKLAEVQDQMQEDQTNFFRTQAVQEMWTTRLLMSALIISLF
jgi:hypothetical protein